MSAVLDAFARIEVPDHAKMRAEERVGITDPEEIRGEIRAAILLGHVLDPVPDRWRGRKLAGYSGHVYLWAESGEVLWIAKPTRSGGLVVKTVLCAD